MKSRSDDDDDDDDDEMCFIGIISKKLYACAPNTQHPEGTAASLD